MKLLSKNQIQEHKSKERQLDIEQGMSFARKVDDLRVTKDKEEAALIKFREDSETHLKKDIDGLIVKRDSLSEEVKGLEETRAKALLPLDEEWKEIRKREEQLLVLERSLSEAFIKSEANKKDLFDRSIEIGKNLEQSRLTLEESKRARVDAENDGIAARSALLSVEKQELDVRKEVQAKSHELSQRELAVGAREHNSDMRDRNQDKRERELNAKDRVVNDKYQTLLRTINR